MVDLLILLFGDVFVMKILTLWRLGIFIIYSTQSLVHDLHQLSVMSKHFFTFSSISEALASELLENLEENYSSVPQA